LGSTALIAFDVSAVPWEFPQSPAAAKLKVSVEPFGSAARNDASPYEEFIEASPTR